MSNYNNLCRYSAEVIFLFLAFGIFNNRLDTDTRHFMIIITSAEESVLVLGDFNGDLGDKGKYPPNQRGSKLLDFANYFNLCPANLLSNCNGPLETYISDCGRHRSTLDYIFVPNCLLGNIISCKTCDMQIENTSDHLPVTLELNYPTSSLDIITDDFASDLESNPKIDWSKFSQEEISE